MAAKKKPKPVDYEKAASKLASCVLFALKFLKAPGSGTMVNMQTGKMRLWQTEFMDALDMVGYEIDREKYFDRK